MAELFPVPSWCRVSFPPPSVRGVSVSFLRHSLPRHSLCPLSYLPSVRSLCAPSAEKFSGGCEDLGRNVESIDVPCRFPALHLNHINDSAKHALADLEIREFLRESVPEIFNTIHHATKFALLSITLFPFTGGSVGGLLHISHNFHISDVETLQAY